MSLKYHIIHFIVKDMEKQLEIDKKKVKPNNSKITKEKICSNLFQISNS